MYRIALLQNQSEAFELSYGDVYSWFAKTFDEYQWDLYSTERSLPSLFNRMDSEYYDAVFFTTNTFNDVYLRKGWTNQSERIEQFLRKNKGILIFQQIKVAGEILEMLPGNLALEIVKRPTGEGEEFADECLSTLSDHILLHYPCEIQTEDIVRASLQNPAIEYLYWSYLIPICPEYWIEVLSDDSCADRRRPLMLVSGPQTPGRIVATSLVIDWQRQLMPLRNLLTYVIEGPHTMAVIRRSGRSSYDFEYLLHNLRIAKHGFREYAMERLDFDALHPHMHDVVVLDPAWPPAEITKDQLEVFRACMKQHTRMIYFDVDSLGEPAVTTVGGVLPFAVRYQQAITYLKDAFDRDSGRWDGSYFSTIHVLDTLIKFGEPLDEYKEPFLEYIRPHDFEGSYDQQFATTCALLRVYHSFLGEDDPRFKQTLNWLNQEIATQRKVESDLARAYLALKECNVAVPVETVRDLQRRISPESINAEEDAFRYISLFLAYGLIEELMPIASRLIQLQRKDGSWGFEERNRLFLTGLIVDLLLSVKDAIASRGTILPGLDGSILTAVIHLKSLDLVSIPPKDKCSTIAAVLQAIRHFESAIRFPIDEFLEEQGIVAEEFRITHTFSTANDLISKLQAEKVKVAEELQTTINELVDSRQTANRIGYIILICVPLLVISLSLNASLAIRNGVATIAQPILSLDLSWLAILFALVILMFALMARRRIIPKKLAETIREVADVLASPSSAFEHKKREAGEEGPAD
jgi:hypothetical protein